MVKFNYLLILPKSPEQEKISKYETIAIFISIVAIIISLFSYFDNHKLTNSQLAINNIQLSSDLDFTIKYLGVYERWENRSLYLPWKLFNQTPNISLTIINKGGQIATLNHFLVYGDCTIYPTNQSMFTLPLNVSTIGSSNFYQFEDTTRIKSILINEPKNCTINFVLNPLSNNVKKSIYLTSNDW